MDDKKVKMLHELALQAGIEQQVDDLVWQAESRIVLLEQSDMEENQLRNVINVAQESRNVAVVTNFVRYQIGRDNKVRQWRHNHFGLRVIEDIEGLVDAAAHRAADFVQERAQQQHELDKQHKKEPPFPLLDTAKKGALQSAAAVQLMMLYLGYLNRAFIFCKKATGLKKADGRSITSWTLLRERTTPAPQEQGGA